jgi:hypothetical protein
VLTSNHSCLQVQFTHGSISAICAMLLDPFQELKSQQQELPAAVAALVRKHQWLPSVLQDAAAAKPANSMPQQATTAAAPTDSTFVGRAIGQAPGLTITSFHLHQLQASKQVSRHAVE